LSLSGHGSSLADIVLALHVLVYLDETLFSQSVLLGIFFVDGHLMLPAEVVGLSASPLIKSRKVIQELNQPPIIQSAE
jgi:hypothetical protein